MAQRQHRDITTPAPQGLAETRSPVVGIDYAIQHQQFRGQTE
jgi:hypothetical protein